VNAEYKIHPLFNEKCVYGNFLQVFPQHVKSSYLEVIAKLADALYYKPEERGFDSRRVLNFSIYEFFQTHYGPEVDSASNRNEYQKIFLRVKGRPPSVS
jgi:hypothetical protein